VFPNPHTVYMHDTPLKPLFERAARAFSSGCIRVQDALGLAKILLRGRGWDGPALERAVAAGTSRVLAPNEPTAILLVYWTAVVDSDETLNFYPDIYSLDPQVLAALDAPVSLFEARSGLGSADGTGPAPAEAAP
jgi:L,D-transpeptidase YcbB